MYWDPSGNTNVYLNDLVSATSYKGNYTGKVTWNSKTKTASVYVNGINKNIKVGEYGTSLKNNRIVIDNNKFDKLFTSNDKSIQTISSVTNSKVSVSYYRSGEYISTGAAKNYVKNKNTNIFNTTSNETIKRSSTTTSGESARSVKGAGNNGAFIRMPTPQEKANDIKAEIIKYIPVASTINDIKIVATGSDFYGHVKNEGEIQKIKEGLVLDTGFGIVTAGFGAEAKYADDLVEGAIKGTIKAGERNALGRTVQPMEKTMDMALNPELYANEVAKKYGINLKGSGQDIVIKYNPELKSLGKSRQVAPNVIEVGPQAFADEKTLANTISHELNHARSWLKGGTAPEGSAYDAGDALQSYIEGGR